MERLIPTYPHAPTVTTAYVSSSSFDISSFASANSISINRAIMCSNIFWQKRKGKGSRDITSICNSGSGGSSLSADMMVLASPSLAHYHYHHYYYYYYTTTAAATTATTTITAATTATTHLIQWLFGWRDGWLLL